LQDISWNGKPEKFPGLKERDEGHFIQALMGHCVHTNFLKAYLVRGGELLNEFSNFMLTEEQLQSDNRVMFGALKSIFRQGQAKRHIRANEKNQDGMRAWVDIVREFDIGGNRDVLIEKYETQVSTTYHCDYTGGITGFVQDYEDAFVQLEFLNVLYDDQRRMLLLLRNLMIPEDTDWMVSHCKDKYRNDFTEACCWLQSKDARRVFFDTNTSSRKAHNTGSARKDSSSKNRPTGIDVDHMAFYISQLEQQVLSHAALDTMCSALLTRNDSHYIAPAMWSQLTPTSK
jgi:hypothetical protein